MDFGKIVDCVEKNKSFFYLGDLVTCTGHSHIIKESWHVCGPNETALCADGRLVFYSSCSKSAIVISCWFPSVLQPEKIQILGFRTAVHVKLPLMLFSGAHFCWNSWGMCILSPSPIKKKPSNASP